MAAPRPATLLDGRVHHAQPADGHRSGLEPVLMAATVPARGVRVLEAGCGAGAGLLCVAARLARAECTGVEREAGLAACARANAAANGWQDRVAVLTGDVTEAATLGDRRFDHAIANPPWHAPAGTASADPVRDAARRRREGLIGSWVAALAARLVHRGTLTLALPAALVAEAMTALEAARLGGASLYPLWPRMGDPARLVLLRGVRGSRAPGRVLAGLVLHGPDGGFTPQADQVLRDGAPIGLD